MLAPTGTKGLVIAWFLVSFATYASNRMVYHSGDTVPWPLRLDCPAEAVLMVLICLSLLSDVMPMTRESKTTPMPRNKDHPNAVKRRSWATPRQVPGRGSAGQQLFAKGIG